MDILSQRSKYAYSMIQEDDDIANSLIKAGKKVIKLNRGDPPVYFETPKYVTDAIIRAIKEGKNYYSSGIGVQELREAVARRQKRLYRVETTSNDVIITQGVSEGLFFINALLINPGDKAIMFRPYYTQHLPDLEIYGGKAIMEKYDENNNWNVDIDSLERNLKRDIKKAKKIKYLIVANPNNPTGTVLDRKILEDIVEIAKNYNILLISDEIYDEITYNGAKFVSMSKLAKGIPHIILNGASKAYDATGWRIGYVIIPEKDATSQVITKKMIDIARSRLSANTPAQYALAEAINNVKEHTKAITYMTKEIEKRVNLASKMINESEYMHTVVPKGAFYIFPKLHMDKLNIKNDKDFVDKFLREEDVQITRGSGFGEKDHIRIVSLAPKEILETAITRLNNFCERHSK